MGELEEKLNQVLSDPAELARLSHLASELLGGGASGNADAPQAAPGTPELLRGLLGGGEGSGGERAALLRALAACLRPERRQRLQRAMRLAKAARAAGSALEAFGGGDV